MSKADTHERKTVLKTIRIPESLARSLEKGAAEEGTTVNSLANAILYRNFEWDRKAREFGFVWVHKPIFRRLVEIADDEELARLGREVIFATWKEMAEFWLQDSTPDGILDALSLRTKFGSSTRTRVTREEDEYTIVLHHEFGPKHSIALKSALQELAKSFHATPRLSAGESVVTARFKVNPRARPPDGNKT
ncbi:MAG: hypothetical protein ABSB29_08780 [Nitrososphaerales archaeon]